MLLSASSAGEDDCHEESLGDVLSGFVAEWSSFFIGCSLPEPRHSTSEFS
jgi:hypothetical protein